jgi:nucleotide-binding universal stress UspA family protein
MSMPANADRLAESTRVPKITVGIEASAASDAALAWAVEEARFRGDSVQAVNVVAVQLTGRTPWLPSMSEIIPGSAAYQQVQAAIDRLGGGVRVPIEIDCRFGSVGYALETEADVAEAELVVVGRSDRGLGHEVFLGSLAHFLCHVGSRPVVIVPTTADRLTVPKDRVAVGVDGTDRARTALRWALREGVMRKAAVHAVYVWDDLARSSTAGAVVVTPDSERTAAQQAASTLRIEVNAALRDTPEASQVPVTAVAVRGSVREALLTQAADADLLVLGDHQRVILSEAILGSTTRMCLRRSASPVVIVPSDQIASRESPRSLP